MRIGIGQGLWGALAALLMIGAAGAAQADPAAKTLFAAVAGPSLQEPEVIGGYAKGCLAGGSVLPEDGPGWQAMRLSRNRRYGHPELLAFVERLAGKAQEIGWPGILVGDLAQPRGGPMLGGHSSHQTGIDGDIWLRPAPAKRLSAVEREEISAINYVAKSRTDVIADFSPEHHALLRAAAEDPAVARIFVNAAIKKALCDRAEARGEDMEWLGRLRPWWGHDHHFHVRLRCPPGSPDCRPQQPPPPGSGCGAEVASWLTPEALNPKPSKTKKKPRPPLVLADLPPACGIVLNAGAR